MGRYETVKLRNLGIVAHGGAGKTSLAEAILFDTGMVDRLGRVDDGSSTMDFEPVNQAATEIDESRRRLESDAVEEVLNLSIAIAKRVTKRLGAIDPQVAIANVAEALKLAVRAADVRIAIHPSQKAALEEAMPSLKLAFAGLRHVEVTADADIAPGGCRLQTGHGRIDGELDTQLLRIVADLLPNAREDGNGPL